MVGDHWSHVLSPPRWSKVTHPLVVSPIPRGVRSVTLTPGWELWPSQWLSPSRLGTVTQPSVPMLTMTSRAATTGSLLSSSTATRPPGQDLGSSSPSWQRTHIGQGHEPGPLLGRATNVALQVRVTCEDPAGDGYDRGLCSWGSRRGPACEGHERGSCSWGMCVWDRAIPSLL